MIDDNNYHGMRVSAELATPVAFDGVLLLDGILAAAAMRRELGDDEYAAWQGLGSGKIEGRARLPLGRLGHKANGLTGGRRTDRWVWLASIALGVESDAAHVARWRKQWDDEHDDLLDFGGKVPKVELRHGRMRAWDMPLVVCALPRLSWIAWGDSNAVRELLEEITAIGKKPSQGYGEVASWAVERDDTVTREMVARRRPVPVEVCTWEGERLSLPARPPYWMREWRTECVLGDR